MAHLYRSIAIKISDLQERIIVMIPYIREPIPGRRSIKTIPRFANGQPVDRRIQWLSVCIKRGRIPAVSEYRYYALEPLTPVGRCCERIDVETNAHRFPGEKRASKRT